jgi:hypothetical protein
MAMASFICHRDGLSPRAMKPQLGLSGERMIRLRPLEIWYRKAMSRVGPIFVLPCWTLGR